MALSFDDKVLGEKVHNYCSSSEDEHSAGSGDENEPVTNTLECLKPPNLSHPGYPQTGPKGVVADYKHFKKLQSERDAEEEQKIIEYAKQHSLSCRPYSEDVKACEKTIHTSESSNDDSDDEFLTQYRQNRINELRKAMDYLPTFNKIYDLVADTFIEEVDNTSKDTTVIVFIYENGNKSCAKVNTCLEKIFQNYPHVKFCRIRASDAHLSYRFSHHGVPAIVVYKNGELIGNLLSITKDLGDEFYPNDLDNYLVEHGFLPDKTLVQSAPGTDSCSHS
ncbi:Phosducin-like protein isoform 3 [Schistosoma japonicum]|uniref:Phosducin-like protein isoform 3 n=2 Tax=Schistosoma japonicum TaxID=6182 RepID=C1LKJ7_SCHJA|nr:Phosducin-like protein [Schistosoma japonicum]TNN21079.1 Phosducin-like protein isoform 3 [Schistosoma japonicum]CAX70456.1 putative Pdc1 protein [Schistosoma japonicum]CAX75224.1 putative Pdc1 protein [Schistosoma japonicum]CAX75225.1 putative Pdc1 protein [Schistosoma japonicum]